ncbi:hypothetical protein JM83_3866 [Gillisia sp. Hel_I_86]|nr:hypothetical protein JM83_3866 [Gillisia sp. Hel_I_86]
MELESIVLKQKNEILFKVSLAFRPLGEIYFETDFSVVSLLRNDKMLL